MAEAPLTMLQKLNKAAQQRNLEKHSVDSISWFQKNARKLIGRDSGQESLLKEQPAVRGLGTPRFEKRHSPIGQMFAYGYDAKHKDTLPYWDRFPLGFYVGPAKGGWFLLNLHYLPPQARAAFFDALISIKENKFHTEKKRLALTYNLLKSTENLYLFKPCFKRYLRSHLASKMVEIPESEWSAALFLPVANFVGAKNSQVWSDSMLGRRPSRRKKK